MNDSSADSKINTPDLPAPGFIPQAQPMMRQLYSIKRIHEITLGSTIRLIFANSRLLIIIYLQMFYGISSVK
jgi:hypothetical protein